MLVKSNKTVQRQHSHNMLQPLAWFAGSAQIDEAQSNTNATIGFAPDPGDVVFTNTGSSSSSKGGSSNSSSSR
jgi:hypothetical protein